MPSLPSDDAHRDALRVVRFTGIADWPLWSSSPRVLLSVLVVELTAVLLVGATVLFRGGPAAADIEVVAILGVLGLTQTEVALRVERVRRQVTGAVHVDLSSVWTFAGAVLLPPVFAAALAVVLQGHLWWRAWSPRVPLYRQVFSIATIVLACLAASTLVAAFPTPARDGLGSDGVAGVSHLAVLVLAILTYTTVNSSLVAGAVLLSSPQPNVSSAVGDWTENLLELATLSLGALTAVALRTQPWLAVFVLPALLVQHRAVLVRQLQEAASTDGKTGLLNAAAWHTQAQAKLSKRGPTDGPWAVLILDLDHFKAVNDTYGHLAGDRVLVEVAEAMRAEVRDDDLIGRFGGEEFVLLLTGTESGRVENLHEVADRIRQRISALRVEMATADGPLTISTVSASVGGAVYPTDGSDVAELLQVADTALYVAKNAGRNTVRVGGGRAIGQQLRHGPSGKPGLQSEAEDRL